MIHIEIVVAIYVFVKLIEIFYNRRQKIMLRAFALIGAFIVIILLSDMLIWFVVDYMTVLIPPTTGPEYYY